MCRPTAFAFLNLTASLVISTLNLWQRKRKNRKRNVIGIHNGRIETVGQNIHDIALDLVGHVVEEGDSLITIYYGQDTSEEDANALGEEVSAMFEDMDVEVQYGGQPLYYYLISAE